MTKQDIKNAYDSMNPSSAQKERMLNAIQMVRPQGKETEKYISQNVPATHWWTAVPAAVLLVAVIAAGIFVLGGGRGEASLDSPTEPNTQQISENQENDTSATANTESIETDLAEFFYVKILNIYTQAITENWEPQQCTENGIGYLVALPEYADQIGYAQMDLNGDGTEELIISDGEKIYDLFTMTDDGPEWILSGSERNSYRLCEGNFIANTGSSSAARTVYHFYRWNGVELEVYDFIIFDASMDENAPWFGGFRTTEENAQPLTEAEAQAVIDSYKVIPIEIKAFEAAEVKDTETQEEASQEEVSQVYKDYVEWLIPWRLEEFENPKQLYYCLTDCNGDGIIDLMLGYEDEFLNVWTLDREDEYLDMLPSDYDWDPLYELWLELDLIPIEEFPLGE